MARDRRIICESGLYHITARGNNKQRTFSAATDFRAYLELIGCYKDKFKFKFYAFVLMTNHVHMLIETSAHGNISTIMKPLSQRYALWHNKKYHRTGHLWENRFHSNVILEDPYLLECIRYIELNPVRSRLVDAPEKYIWSSYSFHAYNKASPVLDWHPIFKELGNTPAKIRENYRNFVQDKMHCLKIGVRHLFDEKRIKFDK